MFEIFDALFELASAYAVSGGFINTTISFVIFLVDAIYLTYLFLLPFNVASIAKNLRR